VTPELLDVRDLRVTFLGGVAALRGVSLGLERGETLAVVGESGAGKSTLAHSLVGLVQPPLAAGSVRLRGQELLGADAEQLRSLRWSTVALVPQNSAFNPVSTLGAQIAEPLRVHAAMSAGAARCRAAELAEEALLDPALLDRYPHELAGGQRRHALLAMALALDPDLMILDEPTAGLDPAGRAALLARLSQVTQARGTAMLVVTHDLQAAAAVASRVVILYAGEAMEAGTAETVIGRPAHPYSRALLNAYPVMTTTKDLRPIRGLPPDPRALPGGCPFHPRCTQAEEVCRERRPVLRPSHQRLVSCHFGGMKTLLSATGLRKTFRVGGRDVRAIDDVSLQVQHGEALGVVGRSGSGKSTLARILAGDLRPDAGEVRLGDLELPRSWSKADRRRRRQLQLIQQDPWDALSPRLTVRQLVREPLDIAAEGDGECRDRAVSQMLDAVGLPGTGGFLDARVHELSGGQLQRIALARALVCGPRLLVADEPTSLLDASEQARLLVVLRERQVEMGLGMVLVSHDLAMVRKVTDRIVVLDEGRVAEEGPVEVVSVAPRSAAARLLVQWSGGGTPQRSDELRWPPPAPEDRS